MSKVKNIKSSKMKRHFKILIYIALGFGALHSCKKMDDTYRQFVEDGETVYIGRADSLKVRGGDLRAEVSWLLISDPKVHEYRLTWNNGTDSIVNVVTKTDEVDTIRVVINDLEEKTHEFTVTMYDKYGNSSVKTNVIGKVFGPRYESSLVNRAFLSAVSEDNQVTINWTEPETQLVYSELSYIDASGASNKVRVEKADETTTLTDFPDLGNFEMISVFIPDSTALDTFYTEPVIYTPTEI